jgi:hypothetical protein
MDANSPSQGLPGLALDLSVSCRRLLTTEASIHGACGSYCSWMYPTASVLFRRFCGIHCVRPLSETQLGSPTQATIKRLFAVSGNRCAFPKCKQPLVDSSAGKVTGRISHIKARSPGGPRYDPLQTEEERHQFDNLLLLCPIHHDVIDDDPLSYSVARLTKMKSEHESAPQTVKELDPAIVIQLIAGIEGNTVTHGSIIFSQNQMGGQLAHFIQNFGPQPRQISQAAANALMAELRKLPAEKVDLSCLMGDTEGYQLATVLKQVFELSGWSVSGVNQVLLSAPLKNVLIETPEVRPALDVLLNWFGDLGLKPQGTHQPGATNVRVVVGGNI